MAVTSANDMSPGKGEAWDPEWTTDPSTESVFADLLRRAEQDTPPDDVTARDDFVRPVHPASVDGQEWDTLF